MKDKRLRAITTRYNGFAFRSRLEARYAVYFDHLGITWDYEPEGFELGNGLRYLPDFWLPDLQMWVEVKPGPPDPVGVEKAARLGEQHRAVVMFCGPPRAEMHDDCYFFGWDLGESGGGFMPSRAAGHFAHVDGELALQISRTRDKSYYADQDWEVPIESFDEHTSGVCFEKAAEAARAARAARFEFGENGGAK